MSNHNQFYDHAALYAAAFSWRHIEAECDFLINVFESHMQRRPCSILELACGPSAHAIEFARRNITAHAMDLSEAMLIYTQQEANKHNVMVQTHCADMTDFASTFEVDLAFCLLDSLSYITQTTRLMAHLSCVAGTLTTEGIYLIELAHPADAFGIRHTTSHAWDVVLDDARLIHVEFGQKDDPFDVLTQIRQTTVKMSVSGGEQSPVHIEETCALRTWLYQELCHSISTHPDFKLINTFGAMDRDVPLTTGAPAWRMVLVLQKCQAH